MLASRLIVFLAMAALVSACEQSVFTPQTGSSAIEGVHSSTGTATSRTREGTVTVEQVATIEMSAFPLIIEAVRRQTGGTTFLGSFACNSVEEAIVWGDDALTPPSLQISQSAEVSADTDTVPDGKKRTTVASDADQDKDDSDMPPALKAALQTRFEQLISATNKVFSDSVWDRTTACASAKIVKIAQPLSGWPVDGMRLTDELIEYIHDSLATAITTNKIMTPIVADLATHPRESSEALIADFAEAFAEQGIHWMREYYVQRRLNRGRHFRRDLTGSGPAPVHFTTSDGWDYQQGPSGVLLTYNGVPWYGAGYFSGNHYTLQTHRRRATRMARTFDLRDETATITRIGTDAGAALPQ